MKSSVFLGSALILAALSLVSATRAFAGNVIQVGTPQLDRPLITSLGVRLPISGDDNSNSSVQVRYRVQGASGWLQGQPLFRVDPSAAVGYSVASEYAGMIFDLKPATTYEIELTVQDPDGPANQVLSITGTTRGVPSDPISPRQVQVSDLTGLKNALGQAQAGDVITIANGFYALGSFDIWGSGTAQNPIVIRGASQDGVILDGGGCDTCNVLNFYGSGFIHLENFTIQNVERAIRFYTAGSQGNVIRRVHIKNTRMGMTDAGSTLDYYICDNILEGRLVWPLVYSSDGGAHGNDDGIQVSGAGHVVCHNRISGYGDALKTEQDGARALDFYGNEVLWTYDNGVELDGSAGNVRLARNRFTNNYAPISVQPIKGGPAYIYRNVVVNTVDEQVKVHGTGDGKETSGFLVYQNTFVSARDAFNTNTPQPAHRFVFANNLFVGPQNPPWAVFNFGPPIDRGFFDFNAYFPDGEFIYNIAGFGYRNLANLSAVQSSGLGFELHGLILSNPNVFASGLVAPNDSSILMSPQDVSLASGAGVIDHGEVLPNITDGFRGAAPDPGAIELGYQAPIYGPRPVGVDERNEIPDSTPPVVSITAPASGTIVSGHSVTISANVSDNVVGVQFQLDGANLGSEVTTSPFTITWDTTTATNGSHNLTALARDGAGDSTTSSDVSITVSQSGGGGGSSGGGGGGCFIATAAYGSALAPQVVLLQNFRDRYLLKISPGQAFVRWYYRVSPPIAAQIRESPFLRLLVRGSLWPIVGLVWLILHSGIGVGLLAVGAVIFWVRRSPTRPVDHGDLAKRRGDLARQKHANDSLGDALRNERECKD